MHIVIDKCLIDFRTRTPFFCIDHHFRTHIKLNQITYTLRTEETKKQKKKLNDKNQVYIIANI